MNDKTVSAILPPRGLVSRGIGSAGKVSITRKIIHPAMMRPLAEDHHPQMMSSSRFAVVIIIPEICWRGQHC
jgi:hypothetical protein